MTRPHTEFIAAQVIPWQRGLYGGARADVEQRTLSLDHESGASSLMIRYPPGWTRDEPEHLDVAEELLVLDGAVTISGQRYGKLDYAYLPAGYARSNASAAHGAVVLTFFSGEPHARHGESSEYDGAGLVRHIDTRRLPGEAGARRGMFEGIRSSGSNHKRLREDPVTGELTWLVGMPASWVMSQLETHPVVEEEFAICGDLVGPRGVMRPGAYFWRPPSIQHGPFGTATGALHLVRSVGGPLTTDLVDHQGSFDWDPAYNPILCPEQQTLAAAYTDCEINY